MAIDLEVIFTGLCLFCLNQDGSPCKGDPDRPGYVYLVDGTEDQRVCGERLDGGHRPRLAFEEKFLMPGSTRSHSVEPAPDGSRVVVSSLNGVELCIRTSPAAPGPTSPAPTTARPIPEHPRPTQRRPWPFLNDADSFDWIVNLRRMDSRAAYLCPQVALPLPRNPLVAARVRLDQGIVQTTDDWHDSWGQQPMKLMRRVFAMDYTIWLADPAGNQSHFPKALPGKASWTIEDVPEESVVLVENCQRDGQGGVRRITLFRLRPRAADGEELELHVTNSPDKKVGSPGHTHLNHFRWYYRLVDWERDGCADLNVSGCPPNLPIPIPPTSPSPPRQELIEGVITQSNKCPPVRTGSQ